MKSKVNYLWFVFAAMLLILQGCHLGTPISPGELSNPHSKLEGTSNCTQCHTLGKRISDSKCLDCHKILKARIDAKKGYHASKEVKGEKCIRCHSEHHGKSFEIVHFDTAKFDHSLSGYKLEGQHAEQNCTDCHKKEHIKDKEILKRQNTSMGLDVSCLGCHKDYHQETLDNDCAQCHDFNDFRPAPGFDHNKAKFALEGKHQEVDCEKCHEKTTRNQKEFQQFSGLNFSNCSDCHDDPHENKFGAKCTDCHVAKGFGILKNESNFNHSLTGFVLKGSHKSLKCDNCHTGASFTEELAHQRCADCHDDYHKGAFRKKGRNPDCKECHTENTFKVPQYTVEQHNRGSFPLIGAHEATACTDCHQKAGKWRFSSIGTRCVSCHNDVHKGEMSSKYYPGQSCDNCHNPVAWNQVRFKHSKTNFALLGKHATVSCRKCHFDDQKKPAVQKFSSLKNDCLSCHKDEHAGQFEENGITDCLNCHAFDNWKAVNFDHNSAAFKLDGKHQNVACIKCHKKITRKGVSFIEYKTNKLKCTDCH